MPTQYRFLVTSSHAIAPGIYEGDGQTYFGYEVVDELPLTGVRFSLPFSGRGGELEATLPESYGGAYPVCGRDMIVIERNGQLVWAGFPWTRTKASGETQFSIHGNSIWSYYTDHLEIRENVPLGTQMNMDLGDIAFRIPYMAQADAPGGPLVIWNWVQTGVYYNGADLERTQGSKVGQIVQSVADSDPGFDFRIQPHWAGDTILLVFEIDFPKIAADRTSDIVLEYGAAIASYGFDENGGRMSNDWMQSGQAPPGGPSAGVTEPPYSVAIDWPGQETYWRLQSSGQEGTSDQKMLDAHSAQALKDRKSPVIITDIKLAPERDDTDLRNFEFNDTITVVIRDAGLDVDGPFTIASLALELLDTAKAEEKVEQLSIQGQQT